MDLEHRVERLESEYRWLRGVLTAALAVIGTAAVVVSLSI
jgi:hypothetical protein